MPAYAASPLDGPELARQGDERELDNLKGVHVYDEVSYEEACKGRSIGTRHRPTGE